MEYILSTEHLTRRFGKNTVVKDVSLHIRQGEIYGLIGRNGAGKTTILKMVGGLIRPTEGKVFFEGMPIAEAAKTGKLAKVGTLIENPGLIGGMTGYDNLRMKCLCGGLPDHEEYILGLLTEVGLRDAAGKKAGDYSLGMRQRLGIALALVGEPDVLILDEPINGLDPQGIAEVRETLLKLHRERHMTILISSHILEELAKLMTTCGILDHGVLLREFSREQMENECRDRVTVKTDTPDKAAEVLKTIGIGQMRVIDKKTLEVYEGVDDTPRLIKALADADVPVREVFVNGQTLEEFFFRIVGGANRAE